LTNQPKQETNSNNSTTPGGSLSVARRIIRKPKKLGATTCVAWRQFMRRQVVSGKFQKMQPEPGFKAFRIQT